MDFRLQFGYGMMEHCRALLSAWGGGHAILSPRDLTRDQMLRLSKNLHKIPGATMSLDPQFYLPHSDHYRLCTHDFWPKTYNSSIFWQGPELSELLRKLVQLNNELATSEIILPGLLAQAPDDDWIAAQQSIVDEAGQQLPERQLLATVALGADALRSSDNVGTLVEASEKWNCQGVYVVAEHPRGQYLVDDPDWLANLIDLLAGLKLAGKRVILGYSNHQELIAAIAKPDAIASGTWMNVRSFPPEKFRSSYEEEIKQRAVWYYCPQALSEYKIPFLDIAYRQGLLGEMQPGANCDGGYAAALFSGNQPSSIGLSEQAGFRHYLHALRVQTAESIHATYDETVALQTTRLDRAESLLRRLTAAGVRGQMRDFSELIDVSRAALAVFNSTRGPIMRRVWNTL